MGGRYVYDIGHHSVLVVRGVRRAHIRCPFHGMSWNLDGTLREIPCRWDFPHVEHETFGLDEFACETWGGFVFIHAIGAPSPHLRQEGSEGALFGKLGRDPAVLPQG